MKRLCMILVIALILVSVSGVGFSMKSGNDVESIKSLIESYLKSVKGNIETIISNYFL